MVDDTQKLFSDFWSWRLRQSPEFATMTGSKAYNHLLEDFTEKRFKADHAACHSFLERAVNLMKTAEGEERNNLEFFQAEVGTFVDGFFYRGFYFPINYMEGVHVDFQRLPEWATLTHLKDYEDLLARYEAFPTYVSQLVDILQIAINKGVTNHAVSMKGVVAKCRSHVEGEVEDCVFFKPFSDLGDKLGKEVGDKLRDQARKVIQESVRLGFGRLADFLESSYLPNCRNKIAVTSLKGGDQFYRACLKFHTSTDLTPEQIHQKGHQEVERIEEEMKQIIKQLGLSVGLSEFIQQLRDDKNNFYQSSEELLAAFDDIIRQKIEPQLTKLFLAGPKSGLDITNSPMADYPAAFYIAGTPDGARSSKLFVNTFKFCSQPKYEMVSLSLHEANPGHHLQADYIIQRSWPEFRKVMEDRVYSQAPSRFPINTAYVEGWALYCETLGKELGVYSDPMDWYGHLSEEIFRAARLVVDTGMHALGWTRDQAISYMLEHTAASKENIEGEVDRYITWPGQATGYKIGQLRIIELRKRAEAKMGTNFDLKEFHQVVLNSCGPLDILEKKVDDYIATVEASN